MSRPTPSEILEQRIASLKAKRRTDLFELRAQLRETGQSLKPANLVKGAARDILGMTGVPSMLWKAGLGLGLALIMKKVTRPSRNHTPELPRSSGEKLLQSGLSLLTDPRTAILRTAAIYLVQRLWMGLKNKRTKKRNRKAERLALSAESED